MNIARLEKILVSPNESEGAAKTKKQPPTLLKKSAEIWR